MRRPSLETECRFLMSTSLMFPCCGAGGKLPVALPSWGMVATGPFGFMAGSGNCVIGIVCVAIDAWSEPIRRSLLCSYGGIYIVSSLLWAVAGRGAAPDIWDVAGCMLALLGALVILYAPRQA